MSRTPSEANRAGYDRWSKLYDDTVNSTVAMDERAFPPVWAHVRGRDVLEIGCGTGRHTLRLAAAGNRVTGMDLSPGMLAEARRKLADFPDVRLLQADILRDEPEPEGFDVVLTALVLEHIADPAAFFARAARALRPGGAFYLSEIHPQRIADGAQANFIDEDGEAVRLTSFAHSAEAIEAAAARAGLRLDRARDIAGDAALAERNAGWARHIGRPMLRVWSFNKPQERR